MEKKHSEQDFIAIAKQLCCPEGEHGIKTGEMMNVNNIGMTHSAIDDLNLQNGEKVLEIGHGNAGHLAALFQKSPGVTFFGIDISETIVDEAKKINQQFTAMGKAQFICSNGTNIPYQDAFFDKIFTVNTIYFWPDPVSYLKEINRVLKPSGSMSICFADKSFMETLPFTPYGFKLYDVKELQPILEKSGFIISHITEKTEQIKSNAGFDVERKYFVVSLSKKR
ncbi:class I SAM-dependent methyltransferase [Pedobacter sp. AW1-32]|uniref:class I SAM-dependent methyltransferase n=1 Tax=Pedobacter sp. AW1-32 TaxID=3383026 RepID=UPI003FEF0519